MADVGSRSLLEAGEVSQRLATVPGWHVEGAELVKSYTFKNFAQAIDFVNAVARIAEAQDHHPDLLVRWGEVTVRVSTHTAGGLTAKDFDFASALDRI